MSPFEQIALQHIAGAANAIILACHAVTEAANRIAPPPAEAPTVSAGSLTDTTVSPPAAL